MNSLYGVKGERSGVFANKKFEKRAGRGSHTEEMGPPALNKFVKCRAFRKTNKKRAERTSKGLRSAKLPKITPPRDFWKNPKKGRE